ncbi:MAG: DUF3311 domain-containing protein [Actinomycetales bacterium]
MSSAPDRRSEPPAGGGINGPIVLAGVLIAAAIILPLWVGSYAKDEPRLFGFPFFYWYQLLWVFIAAGCVSIAYVIVRNEERKRRERRNERSAR